MSTVLESDRVAPVAAADAVTRTEWCLRIGAAACFIGHGAFGIITKEAWVPFFAVAGIGRDLAYALMPAVGAVDIAAGMVVLISPRRIALLYMAVWGLWTALLRPLAGESAFETLERAGNYGVPLALLLLYGASPTWRGWFVPARRGVVNRALVGRVLLWGTAGLLFGHGALQAITQKPAFSALYGAINLPSSVAPVIGGVEMIVAVVVLVAPMPALLIAIAFWKAASESLFPLSGTPIWEFVERGGSYAAPIALVLLSGTSPFTRITFSRSN